MSAEDGKSAAYKQGTGSGKIELESRNGSISMRRAAEN